MIKPILQKKLIFLTVSMGFLALIFALSPLKIVRAEFNGRFLQPLGYGSKPVDQYIPLRLATGAFDPLTEFQPLLLNERFTIKRSVPGEPGYYLVQFKGPIKFEHKKALDLAGARVFDYIPEFAFVVKMGDAVRIKVEALDYVRWVGIYQPGYRIAPSITRSLDKNKNNIADEFVISSFEEGDHETISSQIQSAGGEIIEIARGARPKIRARLSPNALAALACVNGVQWIEPAPQRKLFNDQAADIMTVSDVWQNHGLYGSGQTVAVADTGLDQGSGTTDLLHDDFEDGAGNSRVVQIFDRVGDGADDVNSGHGTHVAGSVLGNGYRSGSTPTTHQYNGYYAGMAPEAGLVFQAVENNTTEALSGIPLDLNPLFLQAYSASARIHTNSWGSDADGAYTTDSAAVDQFMWDHKDFLILFSAGNEGVDANANGIVDLGSISSPATAKNCISVGASENNRPSGSSPGPGYNSTYGNAWPADYPANPIWGDHVSNASNGIAAFSSRGPCLDGRIKPDIVAPGTNVLSTRSSDAAVGLWGLGGLGVGLQPYYIFCGGTSMSTPLAAGAAALAREFYVIDGLAAPSAALIKATLLNGAFDLNPGQYALAYQEISARPNNVQGWGRLDLENALFPVLPRKWVYYDQTTGQTTSGTTHTYNFQADNGETLKVTLAWTDYPGTAAANGGLVNDLDLRVYDPSDVGHHSVDRTNNNEGLDLAAPAGGQYSAWVLGYNVPQGPQPYALVVSGNTIVSFDLIYSASSLQADLVSYSQADLSWTDHSTNETGFKIERKTSSVGVYSQIGSVGAGVTDYSDMTVSAGNTYYYRIKAYNANGNAAPTNEANVVLGVLSAPSGVTVTSVSSSQVSLSWTETSVNEIGFRVERSLSGVTGPWSQVGTTAENVIYYTDSSCSSGTTYYYRIFAYDSLNDSAASNTVMTVTLTASASIAGGGGGPSGGCFILTPSINDWLPIFAKSWYWDLLSLMTALFCLAWLAGCSKKTAGRQSRS